MAESGATIKGDGLIEAGARTMRGVDRGIRALAFAMLEEAQNNVREVGAIDTGSLLNSLYVDTAHDPRAFAKSAAKATDAARGERRRVVGRGKDRRMVGRRKVEIVPDPNRGLKLGQAAVSVSVEHGLYVELGVDAGSATGAQAARPFLTPAAEAVRRDAPAILAAAIREDL